MRADGGEPAEPGRKRLRADEGIAGRAGAETASRYSGIIGNQYHIEFNIDMNTGLATVLLLVVSNIFMTFAWYGHLKMKDLGIGQSWPLFLVILISWGMALLEYCFMIPANKIGFHENGGPFSIFQLKIIQEVISLTVFTLIAMFVFQGEKLHWNHIASYVCLMAAVVFAFLPTK